jgi:hypothetical protein
VVKVLSGIVEARTGCLIFFTLFISTFKKEKQKKRSTKSRELDQGDKKA